jgi:hypothetical protein
MDSGTLATTRASAFMYCAKPPLMVKPSIPGIFSHNCWPCLQALHLLQKPYVLIEPTLSPILMPASLALGPALTTMPAGSWEPTRPGFAPVDL